MGCAAMTALKGLMNLDRAHKVDKVDKVGRRTNLVNIVRVLVSRGGTSQKCLGRRKCPKVCPARTLRSNIPS